MNLRSIDIVNLNPEGGTIFGVWLQKGTCQMMCNSLFGQPDYTLKYQIPGLAGSIGYWVKEHPPLEKVWEKALDYLDFMLYDEDMPELSDYHDDLLAVRKAIQSQKIEKQQELFV